MRIPDLAATLFAATLAMTHIPGLTSHSDYLDIRASCKQVSSCDEAVALWCGGYARADGDGDGIPCENVCHSLEQVEEAKARVGC